LKSKETDSEFCIIKEASFYLSGKALGELVRATLSKEASFRASVKGFSMSPFIKDGDIVTVSALPDYQIYFGRAVAFIHPETDKLVIHRIIGKKGNFYFIKGDKIQNVDGSIPRENILGVVTKVERKGEKTNLGLGIERFLIAFLSKRGLLSYVLWRLGTVNPFLKKRFAL